MIIIKKLVIFLITFSFIFGEKYTAKNLKEEDILNKYRNRTIKLGIYNDVFLDEKFEDDKNIKDFILELFNEYLGLNVEFKSNLYNNLNDDYINGEIDGITLLSRTNDAYQEFIFSDTLMDIELFVVSKEQIISSVEELDNKTVYAEINSIYIERSKEIFEANDLNVNIQLVEDIGKYKENLILTYFPVYYNPNFGKIIGKLVSTSIGLDNSFKDLMPIINNAINEKYKEDIKKKIQRNEKFLSKKNFIDSLTKEEFDYLNTLKSINIGYGYENSILSYFSKKYCSYKGSIPNVINKIGEKLEISINPLVLDTSNQVIDLKSKKVDIIIGSKNNRNINDLNYSKKISEVPIYQIKHKSHIENNGLGVVLNSLEEYIVYNYEIPNNIKFYNNYKLLYKAFNEKKLQSIIVKDPKIYDPQKYGIYFLESRSSNLVYRKDDYLLKSIIDKSLNRLIPIKSILRTSIVEKENEDEFVINEQKKKQKYLESSLQISLLFLVIFLIKMKFDASHKKELLKDPLSKLQNRVVFNEFCENLSDSSKGYIFVIDLDKFKEINNNFGREIGDLIIVEFSKYLKLKFNSKYLFRMVGDEFHGFVEKDLEEIIELFKCYKKHCPLMEKYKVSYSLGIMKKKKREDINNLFKYADLAMIESKKENEFSYKVVDDQFIKDKIREGNILQSLKGSLDKIYPVFQPKIDLNTNKIIGLEALARWNSDELGLVYPSEFIPVAEDNNLIYKIDYRIADESLRIVKTFINDNKIVENFRISFNVSVKTFMKEDLVERIIEIIERHKVPGNYVEIEITESLLVNDMTDIINKLNALIELGIQISLDDFTAGHSTAGILPHLPISIVKLDKSLLDSFGKNEKRAKIVYLNLISLIKELDLKIVAEGIETLEELNFLKESSVDYGQGYFLGRPDKEIKL